MSADSVVSGPMWQARLPGLVALGAVARRAMLAAVLWAGAFGLITWIEVVQFGQEYPTAADRARLVETMGRDVGLQAVFGPARQVDTVAGYVAAHLVGVLSLIGAVWGLLTATRRLRGEEEAGRWELLLAGQTTRRRAAAAAVAGLGVALLAMFAVTAVLYAAIGRLPEADFSVGSSLFAALATVASAAMFASVGALASQVAATRRRATALAAAVFALAYLLRVVAYSGTTLGWLRWASPLGWVDELRPFIGSNAMPLAPVAGFIAALLIVTVAVAGRRDLGAGLLPARDTARARTGLLGGPFGLAVRLARGAALGWAAGLAVGGFLIGVMVKGVADVWGNQSGGMFVNLTGAPGGAIFLGIIFLMVASLVTLAAAGQVAASRDEETDGQLDHLLARPVHRASWLVGRFAVSAAALVVLGVVAGAATWAGAALTGAGPSLATLLAAGLNVVPAGILVLGLGTLVHALTPRLAAIAAYGLVAWSFLIEIIGASLGADRWLLDLSILHHIARAPSVDVRWDSAAILTATGVLAAALGTVVFSRRDLKGP